MSNDDENSAVFSSRQNSCTDDSGSGDQGGAISPLLTPQLGVVSSYGRQMIFTRFKCSDRRRQDVPGACSRYTGKARSPSVTRLVDGTNARSVSTSQQTEGADVLVQIVLLEAK